MKTIEEYYKNGQIEERYTVNKEGKLHGLYKSWYENGQLLASFNFKDGEEHGLTECWLENGQQYARANYKDGNLHGLFEMWDFDREQTIKQYYIERKKVTKKEWEEYNKMINE